MSKSVFLVMTQYDNLGDLIINKCLIDSLSEHTELYVDCTNASPEFIKHIKSNPRIKFVDDVYKFSFKKLSVIKYFLKFYKEFDYIFKSPGPMNFKENKSIPNRLKSSLINRIFNQIKKAKGKSFVIGSEITLESETLKPKLLNSASIFDKFYLRSKNNVEYLRSIGITNAQYIPDLCFLIQDYVKPTSKKSKVGISFRDLNNKDLDDTIKYSVDQYVKFYLELGYQVIFFYQVDRDASYTRGLYERYRNNTNVSFREDVLTLDELDFYGEMRNVMSNRLHVLLMGFVNNSLTVPILNASSTTNKIKGIYESINCSIPIYSKLSTHELNKLESNYEKLMLEISSINEKQYQLCKSTIAEIFVSK